ncbi:MAG: hypothetical protein SO415_08610 [Oliverpabstia sp.]|nr:hypothetical protein [Oliverpabstia sp.]
MSWEEKCIPALLEQRVFLSPQHFSRFEAAFSFLRHQYFFTKGVCKCAVLAAWDPKHFEIFMDSMQEMVERKEKDSSYMIAQGKLYSKHSDNNMRLFAKLYTDFLSNPNQTPSENIMLKFSKNWVPLLDSAITASLVLDKL